MIKRKSTLFLSLSLLSLLSLLSCNVVLHPKRTVNFNGQVRVSGMALNSEEFAKSTFSEIEIFSTDSILLKKVVTDKFGEYSEQLEVKKKWYPLILKVKSLEKNYIDTNIKISDNTKIIRLDFICSQTSISVDYNIEMPKVLKIPCRMSEMLVTSQQ